MTVQQLKQQTIIDDVQTIDGQPLDDHELVDVRGNIKTVFLNHQSILLVTEVKTDENVSWKIIQKERLKNY